MKKLSGLLFLPILIFLNKGYSQCNEPHNICSLSSGYHMSSSLTSEQLAKIKKALNLPGYNIDVYSCKLAEGNPATSFANQSCNYLFIDEDQYSDFQQRYFSHFFIIAHEFAHLRLRHQFTINAPTDEQKRGFELEADSMAASIIKLVGGGKEDCYYAVENLKLKLTDAEEKYFQHPSLNHRKEAIDKGFNVSPKPLDEFRATPYTDYMKDLNNYSFLEYDGKLRGGDIEDYYKRNKELHLFPIAILDYKGKKYSVWRKLSSVIDYDFYFGYNSCPLEEIQKGFDNGFNIEFIDRINGLWYVILLKRENTFKQRLRTYLKSTFMDDVENDVKEGYSIQNIIDYDNYYKVLLTMNKSDGIYAYRFFNNSADFDPWYIQKKTTGKNYLYCWKYTSDGYFAFVQHHPDIDTWTFVSFDGSESSINAVIAKINNGYFIDNITVDDKKVRFSLRKDK